MNIPNRKEIIATGAISSLLDIISVSDNLDINVDKPIAIAGRIGNK